VAENQLNIGTIWMLAHWLLPANATKEDAIELISKAQKQFTTGLELRNKDW
jgi:hypothetical protein